MLSFSSSITVLKPSAPILYLFLSFFFTLALSIFHRPLNQSSILLRSFLKLFTYFFIFLSQNGSLAFLFCSPVIPTFLQTNKAPTLETFLRSVKLVTGILSSTLFTSDQL